MLLSQRQLVSGNYVVSHYGYDGSENVRYLTDSTGAVTDTFDYDAYGNLLGRTGTTANSYLYRGQQFDADLGFYYNRARYYSQQRGRFFTRDEFDGVNTEPRSLHKYLYASGDPVNLGDPSGYLSTVEKPLVGSKIIPPAATAAGIAVGRATTLALARKYLAPAIRCAIFILAGYAGVGTTGLKKTRVDEACEVVGEVAGVVEGAIDAVNDDDNDDDGVVTLFKAPRPSNTKAAIEVVVGYSAADYSWTHSGEDSLGSFFTTNKSIAQKYQYHYQNGLQELNMPASEFKKLLEAGVIQIDSGEDDSYHVPLAGLAEFNRVIKLDPPNRYYPER